MIYLDYAAATPIDPGVIDAMHESTHFFGNPSSHHALGRASKEQVEKARRELADFFGAKDSSEIVFTSGATEANNLAIYGAVGASKIKKPHIITTAIEHKAILEPLNDLVERGLIEVTYLKCDQSGLINIEDVKNEIRHNTILVSVMFVNNETGVVQDIRGIGKMLEKFNENREKAGYPRVLFHTDAVQAVQFYDCRATHLHVDLMSISAHKIYGPKGVGALYVKRRLPLRAMILGGGQEFEKRAGTENTICVAGFARATTILQKKRDQDREHCLELKNILISGLTKLSGVRVISNKESAPHIVSCVTPVSGDAVLVNLDLAGICASSGSACTSGSFKPSHVLSAMGFSPEEAKNSIRFSFGRWTKKSEIEKAIKEMEKILKSRV